MRLPRDLDAGTLIAALARIGYRVVRQTGSHIRLECESPRHTMTVPNHNPIRIGTLSAILADLADVRGLTKAELTALLFG